MLIGNTRNKPSLDTIRRIKFTLRGTLNLPEEAIITVTQLACLEDGCAPLETVIGLLQPNQPQLQFKIHKETAAVNADDLKMVCDAWGFKIKITEIDNLFKES